MKMSPEMMERGMNASISFLEIMSKVMIREEGNIAAGQSDPIEHLDILKKQVEEQYLATLALQELLNRQLPVLKKEAAEEAKKTKPKQSNPTIKNSAKPKITPLEIKLLEQNSLF